MTTQEIAFIEIERLVKNFKNMPTAESEDDRDRVRNMEREIVRVDDEIDMLAHVLYGLSPEEVKVVEGS